MNCRWFLVPLVFVALAAAAPLSLHDAQELLLVNNSGIRSAAIELEKARSEVSEAMAVLWPSLDAKASFIWNTEKNRIAMSFPDEIPFVGGKAFEGEVGTYDRTELGMDLTYPFFTGFSRKYLLTAKREQVAVKEDMLDATRNRHLLQLGLLYLQWFLSYRETDLHEALCRQLTARSEQLEQQFAAGTVIRSRVLEVLARKRLVEVDLAASRQKSDSLRIELTAYIGSDDDSLIPDSSTDTITFNVAHNGSGIDTGRAELAVLEKTGVQIELQRKMIRSRHLPVLAGVAGVRYGKPGLGMGTDAFMGYGMFGAQLTWNIFDGLKGRAQSEQLRCRLDLLEVERERTIDNFEKAYTLALQQMERVRQRREAAQAAGEAAEALAADLETCVEAGTVMQAEYLDALVAVIQAKLVVEQVTVMEKMAVLRASYAAGVELAF